MFLWQRSGHSLAELGQTSWTRGGINQSSTKANEQIIDPYAPLNIASLQYITISFMFMIDLLAITVYQILSTSYLIQKTTPSWYLHLITIPDCIPYIFIIFPNFPAHQHAQFKGWTKLSTITVTSGMPDTTAFMLLIPGRPVKHVKRGMWKLYVGFKKLYILVNHLNILVIC